MGWVEFIWVRRWDNPSKVWWGTWDGGEGKILLREMKEGTAEYISLLLLALGPVIFRQCELSELLSASFSEISLLPQRKQSKKKKSLSSRDVLLFCHLPLQKVNSQMLKWNLGFRKSYCWLIKKKNSWDYTANCFFKYTQFSFSFSSSTLVWKQNKTEETHWTVLDSSYLLFFFFCLENPIYLPTHHPGSTVSFVLLKKYMKAFCIWFISRYSLKITPVQSPLSPPRACRLVVVNTPIKPCS